MSKKTTKTAAPKTAAKATPKTDPVAFCTGWTDDEIAALLMSITKTPLKRGQKVSPADLFDAAQKAGLSRSDLNVALAKAKGVRPVSEATEETHARKVAKARGASDAAKLADVRETAKTVAAAKAPRAKASEPAERETAADRYGITPESVLARIKAEKGCQVGVVRAYYVEHDKAFAKLTAPQQKGLIRRAIRALEAEAAVTKDGATYFAKGGAKAAAASGPKSAKVVAKGGRK